MTKQRRSICDFCKEPILSEEMAEVCRVNGNCEDTGGMYLYFHLNTDRSSKYFGGESCYKLWANSKYSFTPHGIRKISKLEIKIKKEKNP